MLSWKGYIYMLLCSISFFAFKNAFLLFVFSSCEFQCKQPPLMRTEICSLQSSQNNPLWPHTLRSKMGRVCCATLPPHSRMQGRAPFLNATIPFRFLAFFCSDYFESCCPGRNVLISAKSISKILADHFGPPTRLALRNPCFCSISCSTPTKKKKKPSLFEPRRWSFSTGRCSQKCPFTGARAAILAAIYKKCSEECFLALLGPKIPCHLGRSS